MCSRLGIIFCLGLVVFAGCGSEDGRLRDIAALEGEAVSRKQIEQQNENLAKWASEMEADLRQRQRFVDALSGYYVGEKMLGNTRLSVKLVMSSNLPSYQPSGRIRRLEEITRDLNNLYLNVMVVLRDDEAETISGCVFEGIRPDFEKAEFSLAAASCPRVYTFSVEELSGDGVRVSKQILEGAIPKVSGLNGMSVSSLTSSQFRFNVERQAGSGVDVEDLKDQLYAENSNEVTRVRRAEDDLAKRYAYYTALFGVYEGRGAFGNQPFTIRMKITPTNPIYQPDRIRTEAEVADDLNNLYLDAHITEALIKNGTASSGLDQVGLVFGCVIKRVRPDLQTGVLELVSEQCNRSYTLLLADKPRIGEEAGLKSRRLANAILHGDLKQAEGWNLVIKSSMLAKPDSAVVWRVD